MQLCELENRINFYDIDVKEGRFLFERRVNNFVIRKFFSICISFTCGLTYHCRSRYNR